LASAWLMSPQSTETRWARMKIRYKVITLLAALFAVLGVTQLLVQQQILLPSFAELERDPARQDMDRVAYTLGRELDLRLHSGG
jgi:sensor domain CHASE-containing protein